MKSMPNSLSIALGSVLAGLILGLILGATLSGSIASKAQEAAIRGAASEIAKLQVKETKITQVLQKEIIREKVYQDCRHTPDAFEAIKEMYK